MKQGRKSRTVLVIGCALAMLAAVAAIAPAFAGAQAAVDEYELGDLPNPDSDNGTQTETNQDEGAVAPTSSSGSGTPTPPTGVAPDTTGAVVDGGSNGEGKNQQAAGGGSGESQGQGPAATTSASDEQVPALNADPSDGGGAPVLLILLAITAAVCTGVAIWRLRRTTGDPTTGVGPGGAGKTAETQSL
jgi:cobalamin biosynthesis Mg chelatase CobN